MHHSITAHNRFGDEPDQIEYLCKFDGYDHTHDAYLELGKLDDCASLISDYWLSQETDTERYERVKSMALVGSGSGGVCVECGEYEPVVCPGGNCPPCCEMSGYTCCMDQHTAHGAQHAAQARAVDTVDTVDTPARLCSPCYRGDVDAVAHAFRVQRSLSAGELSSEVLVDLGLDSNPDTDTLGDVKHHSYLTVETPLNYCGARISINEKGECDFRRADLHSDPPVSYTHLTLPTSV